jgi:hypothetical protein
MPHQIRSIHSHHRTIRSRHNTTYLLSGCRCLNTQRLEAPSVRCHSAARQAVSVINVLCKFFRILGYIYVQFASLYIIFLQAIWNIFTRSSHISNQYTCVCHVDRFKNRWSVYINCLVETLKTYQLGCPYLEVGIFSGQLGMVWCVASFYWGSIPWHLHTWL